MYHARTKQLQVRYHFIISVLEDEMSVLEKIIGSQNLEDMLTKTIPIEKLKLCTTSVRLLFKA